MRVGAVVLGVWLWVIGGITLSVAAPAIGVVGGVCGGVALWRMLRLVDDVEAAIGAQMQTAKAQKQEAQQALARAKTKAKRHGG